MSLDCTVPSERSSGEQRQVGHITKAGNGRLRMPTMTTRPTLPAETLLVALDLGNITWKLGFRVGGPAQPPRMRTMPARDLAALRGEIAAAKVRVGVAAETPVMSCYEAGRDGFWLHHALTASGVTNVVVDSASIDHPRADATRSRTAWTPRRCSPS